MPHGTYVYTTHRSMATFIDEFEKSTKRNIPKWKSFFPHAHYHTQSNTHARTLRTHHSLFVQNVFISLSDFPSVLFGTANESVHTRRWLWGAGQYRKSNVKSLEQKFAATICHS